jgi:hypothetical protein
VNELTTLDSYCQLNKTSLVFNRDVSQEEWESVFNSLKLVEGCVQFWLGDCLRYREHKWGGMYDYIPGSAEYSKKALENFVWVSNKVDSSLRRENLRFEHHKQVAALPPERQQYFLDKAVDEKLTVRELKKAIQGEKEPVKKEPEKKKEDPLKNIRPVPELMGDEFVEAYGAMRKALVNARGMDWKTTSREVAAKYIYVLLKMTEE